MSRNLALFDSAHNRGSIVVEFQQASTVKTFMEAGTRHAWGERQSGLRFPNGWER